MIPLTHFCRYNCILIIDIIRAIERLMAVSVALKNRFRRPFLR